MQSEILSQFNSGLFAFQCVFWGGYVISRVAWGFKKMVTSG